MRRFAANPTMHGVAVLIASAWSFGSVDAQESGLRLPRGQMGVTYQSQKTQDLVTSHGTRTGGAVVRTHLVDFEVTYRLKERWTLHAGLPVISREAADGPPNHNPANIIPPQDSEFVDDGHFHTYLQDLRLGTSFLVIDRLVSVEPYLEYGIPASNYPFFAASAVGRNIQTLEVGTNVAYRPPFLRWYFSTRLGYQMADEVLGYDINAVRASVEANYFFRPRLTFNAFVTSKNGKGWTAPVTPDLTTITWYHHDQLTRHNFVNLGVGVNWSLNQRSTLNFTTLKMVHAEDVFKLKRAASITLSRWF